MISITTSSRQLLREPWMLDQLSYEWSILLKLTIDSTTTATYTSTTNSESYLIFCKKKNMDYQLNPHLTCLATTSYINCTLSSLIQWTHIYQELSISLSLVTQMHKNTKDCYLSDEQWRGLGDHTQKEFVEKFHYLSRTHNLFRSR